MITANDVRADELINRLKEELKKSGQVKPPEWASYSKTGVSRERPPTQDDWWYIRAAAVMRKIYLNGPMGTQRLRVAYGSAKNRGVRPSKFAKGSGAVIRNILKQLESAQLLEKNSNKGRILSAKGRSTIDKLLKELKK